jgi:hypothetical protein
MRRCSLVRLRKRPPDFVYCKYKEPDLLSHVRARQPYYLGCVYSVIRDYVKAGRPRTDERRHSFTAWVQSLDWIMQHVFKAPYLMYDDHDAQGQPYEVVERSARDDTSAEYLFSNTTVTDGGWRQPKRP